MDLSISHPMTSGSFASSPPRIVARQIGAWLAENRYVDDIDANIAVHAALTSIVTEAPVFGLRLGIMGGRRDGPIDIFVFRMADVMKASVFQMVLDHALRLSGPAPNSEEDPELRQAQMQRASVFQEFVKSRQSRKNTFFYGFVTYEQAAPSLIIGAESKVAQTIEVVVGSFAFKQPKDCLTAAEIDELGVDAAVTEMSVRGGKLFRFPPPGSITSALSEYVLRAQLDAEKQQEEEEGRTPSGLILPPGGGIVR